MMTTAKMVQFDIQAQRMQFVCVSFDIICEREQFEDRFYRSSSGCIPIT